MYKKSAFTMVELVMTIVVLGIVASIGANIIAKVYENYIKTRAINKLQAQSEIVLNEIAKRLQFRIKDSVIARNDSNFSDYVPLSDANDSYQILEWIGKDNDSFKGLSMPGWSGFIDLDSNLTKRTLGAHGKLKTPGSHLNIANSIMQSLSNEKVSLLDTNSTANRPALIFRGQSTFDLAQYGWDGIDGNYTYKVKYTAGTNDVLVFDENTSNIDIFEHYDLSWSAYSIVPEGNNTNDFNLTMHYNYQPWENERYDQNATSSVLAEHVSTFKFTKTGDTIRLKLCISDANGSGGYDFAFCKEKVVY